MIKHQKISFQAVILYIILFMIPCGSSGLINPDTYLRKLWNDYGKCRNDSSRIVTLGRIAYFCLDYLDDERMADSISEMANDIAERSYRSGLLLLAYNNYLESNDLYVYNAKALHYALEACKIASAVNDPGMEWHSSMNLVNVYLLGYRFDKALVTADKALSIAAGMEDNARITESYLAIGKSQEGNNDKIEAFRSYLNAVYLAEKMQNKPLLVKCYSQLSAFYRSNKLIDKALEYKLKQGDLIRLEKPVDSVALMWILFDLQNIDIMANNELDEKTTRSILQFGIRNRNQHLVNYEFTLYRVYLISTDRINQLYDLYTRQYPAEYRQLATDEPAMYCRIQALFKEKEGDLDSAFFYARKAEILIRDEPNKILQSRFFNRYGYFLAQHNMKKEAINKLLRSYDLAKEASYFDYMLDASRQLESLYAGMGDFRNAYDYAVRNQVLTDSINDLTKKDEMVKLEINHEARQRELYAEMQKQKVLRRHNIQYTAIPLIIVGVFILMIIIGSFRIPEWGLRVLGFFSFIFLFEFIILIADHWIFEVTQGEPWKILLIKIGLIAILLPLHEWLEKRVIEYLLKHKLINFARYSPLNYIRRTTLKKKHIPAD